MVHFITKYRAAWQDNEIVIISSRTTKCTRFKGWNKGRGKEAAFYNIKLMRYFSCKSHFFIKTVIEKGHAVQQVQCFIYAIEIPRRA